MVMVAKGKSFFTIIRENKGGRGRDGVRFPCIIEERRILFKFLLTYKSRSEAPFPPVFLLWL